VSAVKDLFRPKAIASSEWNVTIEDNGHLNDVVCGGSLMVIPCFFRIVKRHRVKDHQPEPLCH